MQTTRRVFPHSGRQTRIRWGFTLIEVLVVVAIIALLVSILIPALTKARDQAKRAVCTNNMHQQLLAMNSYAHDSRGFMPWRGYFSYSISEHPHEAYGWGGTNSKVLVNLALLIGKHLGKDWNVIYCPSTYDEYRDDPVGGLPSLYNPARSHSYGGYNYALPMAARKGAPKFTSLDVYPRTVAMLEESYWLPLLLRKYNEKFTPTKNVVDDEVVRRMMPRGIQPVVMDFVMGGGRSDHRGGLNVAYSDGHARFQKHDKLIDGGKLGREESYQIWYDMTHKP